MCTIVIKLFSSGSFVLFQDEESVPCKRRRIIEPPSSDSEVICSLDLFLGLIELKWKYDNIMGIFLQGDDERILVGGSVSLESSDEPAWKVLIVI